MYTDLDDALVEFFTNAVDLPTAPAGLVKGALWLEIRKNDPGWGYPWRILGYENGIAQGYPCGDPKPWK